MSRGFKFRYVPLDELLARPPIRILRALRRFDWLYVSDLRSVLDIDSAPYLERNAFSVVLGRLIRGGLVERRESPRTWPGAGRNCYDVRLTARGRAELERRLAPDLSVLDAPARPGTEHLLCA